MAKQKPMTETQKSGTRDVIVTFTENVKDAFACYDDGKEFVKNFTTILTTTINPKVDEEIFKTSVVDVYQKTHPSLCQSLEHIRNIAQEKKTSVAYLGLKLQVTGVPPQRGELRNFVVKILTDFCLDMDRVYKDDTILANEVKGKVDTLLTALSDKDVNDFVSNKKPGTCCGIM